MAFRDEVAAAEHRSTLLEGELHAVLAELTAARASLGRLENAGTSDVRSITCRRPRVLRGLVLAAFSAIALVGAAGSVRFVVFEGADPMALAGFFVFLPLCVAGMIVSNGAIGRITIGPEGVSRSGWWRTTIRWGNGTTACKGVPDDEEDDGYELIHVRDGLHEITIRESLAKIDEVWHVIERYSP